jgi:hypothetical protein
MLERDQTVEIVLVKENKDQGADVKPHTPVPVITPPPEDTNPRGGKKSPRTIDTSNPYGK